MRTAAADRIGLVFSLFDGDGRLEAADFELMAGRVVQATLEYATSDKAGIPGDHLTGSAPA